MVLTSSTWIMSLSPGGGGCASAGSDASAGAGAGICVEDMIEKCTMGDR